jgi:hypothetical protein
MCVLILLCMCCYTPHPTLCVLMLRLEQVLREKLLRGATVKKEGRGTRVCGLGSAMACFSSAAVSAAGTAEGEGGGGGMSRSGGTAGKTDVGIAGAGRRKSEDRWHAHLLSFGGNTE